jgi:predicted enzyme related to lactoylglutathione lyase
MWMPKYWFDHVHVMSPDLLKDADFYVKTFGAKKGAINEVPGGRKSIDLDLGGVNLKITSPRVKPLVPGASLTGLEHYGIATDNIEAAVAEIKKNGGKIVQEVGPTPSGGKFCFFTGPQNVLCELVQKPK